MHPPPAPADEGDATSIEVLPFAAAAPARLRERLQLVVVTGGACSTFDLEANATLVVGRGPECDVRVAHPSVSRRHAAITLHDGDGDGDGGVSLVDLGSANGTRVAGHAVAPRTRVEVRLGDAIELGAAMAVVQRIAAEAPPASARTPATGSAVIVREPSDGDRAMAELHRMVERVASGTIAVLILGETGAGKEVLAQALHRASPRRDGRLLTLHCAALPESLLESELFGHERGAFTGAVAAKAGLLESADGGTLFLDEVGELPLSTQVKLLRVLEERRVQRLGALSSRAIDVRLVAATNRDLEVEVARGAFRSDLYYRLAGITLQLPPLRTRHRGLDELIVELLQGPGAGRGITAEALALLRGYGWPGNVRELRNVLERAVLLAGEGPIDVRHLPSEKLKASPHRRTFDAEGITVPPTPPEPPTAAWPALEADGGSLRDAMDALERERIVQALEAAAGNQTKAARSLGLSRNTLLARLDRYGIARPRKP